MMSSNFIFQMIQKLRGYATNERNKNQSIYTKGISFYYSKNIYSSKVIQDLYVNPRNTAVFPGQLSLGSLFRKKIPKKISFGRASGECVFQIKVFIALVLQGLRHIYADKCGNKKQGNRENMQKIQVTRHFFEAAGPQGHNFEKTKKLFLDMVYGSMCTKFQVCIVFHLARRRDTNTHINK